MCEAVGLFVTGLKRVRVGELRLGKLAEGEWRFVKSEEFRHRPAGSAKLDWPCLLYTSPSPRDRQKSRMPSSA